MDEYNRIKKDFDDKLLFKLSQIGFGLNSDLLFTNRIPICQNVELVNHLKHGNQIFISTPETNIDLNRLVEILILKSIKVYFYLMCEPIVDSKVIELLLPVTIKMFVQNNVYNHPNVHIMPIGIRDCETVFPHHHFNHQYLFNEQLIKREKNYCCLLCFSDNTHYSRKECYNQLKDQKFVINLNDSYEQQSIHCGKVPVCVNYEYTHQSDYALSPRGYGEDTHRFYECIYLDTIPIVKRTNTVFDKLYNLFPCLIINHWSEVTEELLLKNKSSCTEKMKVFKNTYPNFLTNLDSIRELLLKL